jgi:hypothetical protein
MCSRRQPTSPQPMNKTDIIANAIHTNQSFSAIRNAFVTDLALTPITAAHYARQIRKIRLSKNRKLMNAVSAGKVGLRKAVKTLKAL